MRAVRRLRTCSIAVINIWMRSSVSHVGRVRGGAWYQYEDIKQNQGFRVELETRDQDTVKLMVTALGKASRRRTRIALDLVHDASEITRRRLIESRLDQDAACIGGKIRKNRPDLVRARES